MSPSINSGRACRSISPSISSGQAIRQAHDRLVKAHKSSFSAETGRALCMMGNIWIGLLGPIMSGPVSEGVGEIYTYSSCKSLINCLLCFI